MTKRELEGKVAIVTGAAGGIGRAIVRRFLAAGATVVGSDRNVECLGEESAAFLSIMHDIANEGSWTHLVDIVLERFDRIDILVNNAAKFDPASFLETTLEDLDAHYQVNQRGLFIGLKAVVPVMVAAGRGSVVNISSTAGLSGSTGAYAYAASKWAVRGMSRSAAVELAGTGVRINTILPGLIDSAMMARNSPERNNGILNAIPLKRAGTVDEVAECAVFLASDASSYMTGSETIVDGGLSA